MAAVAMNPSHEPGECDLALATHLGDLAMALIPPDGHDDRDEHEHEHAGKLHDVRHGGRIDLDRREPDG